MKTLKRWLTKTLLFFLGSTFLLMVVLALSVDEVGESEGAESNVPESMRSYVRKAPDTVIIRIEDGEPIYGSKDEQLSVTKQDDGKQTAGDRYDQVQNDKTHDGKGQNDRLQNDEMQSEKNHGGRESQVTNRATKADPQMKSSGVLDQIGREAGDALSYLTREGINRLLGGTR